MNQKIFNNLILLFIIFFIIKTVSPEPDSILFILKKYVNYFSFQIKKFLGLLKQNENFKNITFNTELAPKIKSPNQINFVNYYKLKNPKINEIEIQNIYEYIQTLVISDVYNTYLNSSDTKLNNFTDLELNKIKDILLTRLNYGYVIEGNQAPRKNNFNFNNFSFEHEPKYYLNKYGKEVDPFTFRVDSELGELRIYIDIDIRNDIHPGKDYVVINEIKPLRDNQIINSYKNVSKALLPTQFKHNDINLQKNTNEIIYNEDEFQNNDYEEFNSEGELNTSHEEIQYTFSPEEFDNQNEIIY